MEPPAFLDLLVPRELRVHLDHSDHQDQAAKTETSDPLVTLETLEHVVFKENVASMDQQEQGD